MIWLWVQHKESFQRAFAKSGRIDVDPECKWLIQAAVDAAIRALAAELSLMAQKAQVTVTAEGREKGAQDSVAKAELQVASTVSKALMTEMCIDEDIVSKSGRSLELSSIVSSGAHRLNLTG